MFRLSGMLRLFASAAAIVAVSWPASAQAQDAPAQQETRLRLYLECGACERDYVRQELTWLDFMRDRQDADVHVLVTTRQTGTGGREFTMYFEGLRDFENKSDTLTYVASPDATAVQTRAGLLRKLKIGLMAYIGDLPLSERVVIQIDEQAGTPGVTRGQPARDPWNYWVFRVGGNVSANGESQQSFTNFSLNLSADRITDAWKIRNSVFGSYRERVIDVDSTQTITSITRSYNGSTLVARSLGRHLSAGIEASLESNTFGNTQLATRIAPAIEYNIFPYSESTRRLLTLLYSIGMNNFDYREETIYDRTHENLGAHTLSLSYTTRQTWGNATISASASQFLHDSQKFRASIFGFSSIRLVRGLSLNINASYTKVQDQLSIAKRDATRDEILLRIRQLETNFFYGFSFGLSYRFGSAIDNIVNPRFDRGIAGGEIFFF
ncbi:MAG: hypothetical protein L0271_09915 [Gemmatimonadetes bacterium]|nr:hypothetical protein [Gemmatimonadota bacterium]